MCENQQDMRNRDIFNSQIQRKTKCEACFDILGTMYLLLLFLDFLLLFLF